VLSLVKSAEEWEKGGSFALEKEKKGKDGKKKRERKEEKERFSAAGGPP